MPTYSLQTSDSSIDLEPFSGHGVEAQMTRLRWPTPPRAGRSPLVAIAR